MPVAGTMTIKVRRNGPYRVDGEGVTIIDWQGQKYAAKDGNVVLCRCGASANKPFCDGAHSRIGFAPDPPNEDSST